MIVTYLKNHNRGYLARIDPTIIPIGQRLMVRAENQPVGMDKVNRVLPFSSTNKLMSPVRSSGGYLFQSTGPRQNSEAQ